MSDQQERERCGRCFECKAGQDCTAATRLRWGQPPNEHNAHNGVACTAAEYDDCACRSGREPCSCGKPFLEDGGADGVCECCSGCMTGREPTAPPEPPMPEPWEIAWASGGEVECCVSGRCEVCAPGGFGGSRHW